MISKIMQVFEFLVETYDPTPVYYDIINFSIVSDLVKNKKIFCKELNGISGIKFKDISTDTAPDKYFKDSNWTVFFLIAYGNPIESNILKCPETYSILSKHKNIKTAMFSILPPNSFMEYHRGPYKGVLRCLFKLKLEDKKGDVGLDVMGTARQWKDTECIIFDDTLQHKAWNLSNGNRVVLFLDLIRPLPFPLSCINRFFLYLISKNKRIRNIYKFYKQQNNLKD
jgi:beta-hydroxylase